MMLERERANQNVKTILTQFSGKMNGLQLFLSFLLLFFMFVCLHYAIWYCRRSDSEMMRLISDSVVVCDLQIFQPLLA